MVQAIKLSTKMGNIGRSAVPLNSYISTPLKDDLSLPYDDCRLCGLRDGPATIVSARSTVRSAFDRQEVLNAGLGTPIQLYPMFGESDRAMPVRTGSRAISRPVFSSARRIS